ASLILCVCCRCVHHSASRTEGFGLVNVESMSVGKLLIASAASGIPEIIRDDVDGFLVPLMIQKHWRTKSVCFSPTPRCASKWARMLSRGFLICSSKRKVSSNKYFGL